MDANKYFDSDYLRLTAVIASDKYLVESSRWKNIFASLGCPVPKDGFNNVKVYHEWENLLHSLNEDGKTDYIAISPLKAILKSFNLDAKNTNFITRIRHAFYFNRNQFNPKTSIKLTYKDQDNPITVTVYPWTTEKTYRASWNKIKALRNKVTEGKVQSNRNSKIDHSVLARELKLYNFYLKAVEIKKTKNLKMTIPKLLPTLEGYQQFLQKNNISEEEIAVFLKKRLYKLKGLFSGINFSPSLTGG